MRDFFENPESKPEQQTQLKPLSYGGQPKLRIIPLGGVGEMGMNMMLFEYGQDMFAIDCGSTFPDEELLGVDLVIPDINYILDNRERFRGVILTHAHEDHIGGLPYLLEHLNTTVWGTRLTCEIARERLKEFRLEDAADFRPVDPGDTIDIGSAQVEFIHITHSVPDALATAIRLPFGNIIVTGDYKIDSSPLDNRPFDYAAFARYGDEGVLVLLADSTNVERAGFSRSERSIIPSLDRLFADAQRTIVVSCFSSSLHRVQILIDLAIKHDRKVFVSGLNMSRNIRIAQELGVLRVPPDVLFDIRDLKKAAPEKRVIVTTGSQGEPLSALSRMALGEHKEIQIKPGDTVILSSRIIPGNEKAIYRMINHLFRRGAEVYYDGVANVHVSGHAHRDEMKMLISLCKPKYFIPIHGEFRHLIEHKHVAVDLGIDPEKVFILQNGDVIEMDHDGVSRGEKIAVSRILVDGKDVGTVDDIVLRDRKHLSEDGMVIVMLVIDQASGQLVAGPDIVSRGFLYMDENEDFFDDCKETVLQAFNDCEKESKEEWSVVKAAVRRSLKKFIKVETGRFPVILPVVLEI